MKGHLRAQAELQEGIQGPKKGYLGFAPLGVDETSVRRACAQPAQRNTDVTPYSASRGKASLVYGKAGNPQEKLRFGIGGGAYVRN